MHAGIYSSESMQCNPIASRQVYAKKYKIIIFHSKINVQYINKISCVIIYMGKVLTLYSYARTGRKLRYDIHL